MPDGADVGVPRAASYSGGARADFETGDVLCFRGRGMGSRVIRWMTKSRYSHVGLAYLFEGRVYCLEAVGSGVRLMLMSELMRHYEGGIDRFVVPDAAAEQRARAIGFGFAQLGRMYDRARLLRFAQTILLERDMEQVKDDQQWFCSELVAAAYRAAGHPLLQLQPAYTSPEDLANSPRLRFAVALKP